VQRSASVVAKTVTITLLQIFYECFANGKIAKTVKIFDRRDRLKASVLVIGGHFERYVNYDTSSIDLGCLKYSLSFNFVQRNEVIGFTD